MPDYKGDVLSLPTINKINITNDQNAFVDTFNLSFHHI